MAKDLKEQIEIMTHYLNGGEIECSIKRQQDWKSYSSYYWNWQKMDYRIKKPKQKVTIEKWLCRDNNSDIVIFETSNVDKHRELEKVKLIKTYKIEL